MSSFPKEINPEKEDDDYESDNSSNIIKLINNLEENTNLDKLREINAKCVDLIFEEKPKKSLEYLKKLESFLESSVIDTNILIPKKFIIIILHNIACCFYKLKDLDNCVLYFDALIYHFDKNLENKYKISMTLNYFDSLIKSKNIIYEKKNLGEWVLDLRFSAKFHIQMSVLLSQAKRYVDSLYHAKLAGLICEDNIIKMSYLYQEIQDDFKNIKENGSINELNKMKEQINLNYTIISDLKKKVLNLRNNPCYYSDTNNIDINKKNKKKINTVYNNYFMYIKTMIKKKSKLSLFNKITNNESEIKKRNLYDSYDIYRKEQIDFFLKEKIILTEVKNNFEKKFIQKDDWLKKLTLDNVISLSALNYEDLDFDSDSKYELLRDSLLEKVVMFSVSYYCIANELRFLSKDKNNKNTNGEYYHYNALYFALIFLPPNCPIVNHFIKTYQKNYYKQGLDIVPEGEIINYKLNLTKKEVINDNENINNYNDYIYLVKTQKINKTIKQNYISMNNIKSKSKENKSIIRKKGILLYNDEYFTKNRKKNLINNIRNSSFYHNIKKYKLINISDSNIFDNKRVNESNISKISNSQNSNNTSIELDIKNMKLININFDLMPNNNYIQREKNSKIKDLKVPKFKLNLNNINFINNMNEVEESGNKTNKNKKDNKYKIKRDIINTKINLNSSGEKNVNNKNNSKKENKKILGNAKEITNFKKKLTNKRDFKDFSSGNILIKNISNNQLNKSINTNIIKITKINKLANLAKYFNIKDSINFGKGYLTERYNLKADKKLRKRKEINSEKNIK